MFTFIFSSKETDSFLNVSAIASFLSLFFYTYFLIIYLHDYIFGIPIILKWAFFYSLFTFVNFIHFVLSENSFQLMLFVV